ncbi:MAG TPA: tetratricopeptide repeat protein, partial [Candidatus Acidoferrales bacterium]|nr:tetratricopeptide repeat protein [Candidatus Acidoferrales bacterium]
MRRRFQRAAGISSSPEEAPKPAPAAPMAAQEFVVPVVPAELDEPAAEEAPQPAPAAKPAEPMGIPMAVESVVHEVDLSDEWAALSEQLESTMREDSGANDAGVAALDEDTQPETPVLIPAEQEHAHAGSAAEAPSFDLQPQAVEPVGVAGSDSTAVNSLIADLTDDLDSVTASLGGVAESHPATAQRSAPPARPANPPAARPSSGNGVPVPEIVEPLSGPLGDLFEEFRSELGESAKEDEDLETHYNLGIAYREMGLLEEAISEFQKVASSA